MSTVSTALMITKGLVTLSGRWVLVFIFTEAEVERPLRGCLHCPTDKSQSSEAGLSPPTSALRVFHLRKGVVLATPFPDILFLNVFFFFKKLNCKLL